MTLRDRSSKKLIAVSLALIMFISMGGMAFVGGAAAETGGTFDGFLEQQEDISSELNIDEDDQVVLVGPGDNGDVDRDAADVNPDGSIEIGTTGSDLKGVALTPDRVASVTDAETSTSEQADFLDEVVVGDLEIEQDNSDAFPAIVADFAPQSDFSQIEVGGTSVSGDKDFIIIANESDVDEDGDNILAVAVDNDENDLEGDVLADEESFEEVVNELVDEDNEQPVENEYLENVLFTAVTDDGTDRVEAVTLGEDGDFATGETLHSEKIELSEDGEDDRYFNSIHDADQAADDNNDAVITVDAGEYDALEDDGTLGTEGLTVTTTEDTATQNIDDRFEINDNAELTDSDDEAELVDSLELAADGITVEELVVGDSVEFTSDASDATLNETVVLYDGSDEAVNVSSDLNTVTVTDSAILNEDHPEQFESDNIGLDINGAESATVSDNYFVGFTQQVTGLNEVDTPDVIQDHTDAFFEDDRTQLAEVSNSDGDLRDVDTLYGSLADADANQANAENTIRVAPGVYFDDSELAIETNDITINGVDTPEIQDDVQFNDSNNATFDGFEVTGTEISNDGAADDSVTIQNVDLPENDSTINISAGDFVEIDHVEFTGEVNAGIPVNISATEPDVTVNEVTVEDFTQAQDSSPTEATEGVGVLIHDAGAEIDVTSVTIDGDVGVDQHGIGVGDIDTTSDLEAEVNIQENHLLNLSDGTGIELTEADGNDDGRVIIESNEIRGGSELIGIEYNLPNTVGSDITGNTIVGDDVTGAAESVGVKFEAVTVSGDGIIADPDDADQLTFTENTITGHARIVDSNDDELATSDYDAIAGNDASLDTDNDLGTLVLAPDDTTYEETFGDIDGEDSYLPGSVDQAVELIDTEEIDTSELEVKDPEIGGLDDAPTTYDEGGETVTIPDMEGLTLTGEGAEQAPLVEDVQIEIASSGEINNHRVANLDIKHENGNAAIDVTSGDNSQSEFDNLNVTSDGVGLDVSADDSDVNVIEITDSDFTVEESGIVLADSTGDDRDGFVINDVSITGPGIDEAGHVGLNLSEVDKPGKDELPTELEVIDVDVSDFEVQLELSDDLTDLEDNEGTQLNVSTIFNDEIGDIDAGQQEIIFADNTFEQAVLILESDDFADVREDTNSGTLVDEETLYGSIDTADEDVDVSDDVAIVDIVAEGDYDEDVTIAESGDGKTDLLVRGPQAGVEAGDAFRNGEAVILGAVDFGNGDNYDGTVALDGVTVVDDNDQVIEVDDESNEAALIIANTAVATTDADTDGINLTNTSDEPVDIEGVFVGDHTLDGTTEVENGLLTDDDIGELTVDSTEIAGGAHVAVELDVDSTVTITESDLSEFASGIESNSIDADVVVSDTTIADHTTGIDIDTAGDVELTINESSTVETSETGVSVEGDQLTLNVTDEVTISENDVGVQIDEADTDSSITQTEFDANEIGLVVNAISSDLTVENNAFTNDETDIENTDGTLDAELNYFGTDRGPASGAAAGIVDDTGVTTIYDPFLSEDQTADEDVSETTEFGHDVIIPADSFTTIGFPAEPKDDDAGDRTLDQYFDDDLEGTIFGFENAEGEDPRFSKELGDFENTEVDAFDGFVVENTDEENESVVTINYGERDPSDIANNRYTFTEGLNFVSPAQAGSVDEVLFPGGDTDVVAQPFTMGDNLYGDENADQVRDSFVDPDEAGFGDNFRSGAGDRVVHPHAAYLVIVNEDDNEGLETIEQIPTPDQPTADNIDDRTNVSAVN